MKLIIFVVLYAFLGVGNINSQPFSNTLTIDDTEESPVATIDQISWLQGYWTGKAFGGLVEEFWSPPQGNSMMCVFKSIINGKVSFYELVTITEENQTLMMRLKHFNPDLKGWEEKDKTQDFRLVKIDSNRVYFDSFTLERVGPDEINMYVVFGAGDNRDEHKFNYRRTFINNQK